MRDASSCSPRITSGKHRPTSYGPLPPRNSFLRCPWPSQSTTSSPNSSFKASSTLSSAFLFSPDKWLLTVMETSDIPGRPSLAPEETSTLLRLRPYGSLRVQTHILHQPKSHTKLRLLVGARKKERVTRTRPTIKKTNAARRGIHRIFLQCPTSENNLMKKTFSNSTPFIGKNKPCWR